MLGKPKDKSLSERGVGFIEEFRSIPISIEIAVKGPLSFATILAFQLE
jgi:hypothetical protein